MSYARNPAVSRKCRSVSQVANSIHETIEIRLKNDHSRCAVPQYLISSTASPAASSVATNYASMAPRTVAFAAYVHLPVYLSIHSSVDMENSTATDARRKTEQGSAAPNASGYLKKLACCVGVHPYLTTKDIICAVLYAGASLPQSGLRFGCWKLKHDT